VADDPVEVVDDQGAAGASPALVGEPGSVAEHEVVDEELGARGVHKLDHGAFAGIFSVADLWVRTVGSRDQAVLADEPARRRWRSIAVAAGDRARASFGVEHRASCRLRERCGLGLLVLVEDAEHALRAGAGRGSGGRSRRSERTVRTKAWRSRSAVNERTSTSGRPTSEFFGVIRPMAET
jgi:hypothetical protein